VRQKNINLCEAFFAVLTAVGVLLDWVYGEDLKSDGKRDDVQR